MTKILAVLIGSGVPGYLAWSAAESQPLMLRFWITLVVSALGWYVSRRFVRNHLDF